MKKIYSLIATLLLCAVTLDIVVAGAPTLFRYKDAKGTVVTTAILPPEAAEKGYDIVSLQGEILQHVAAAPPPEEREAFLKKQAEDIEQAKYDKALVLRYGSLAELMKAQKRKGEESGAKMAVLSSNLTNIKNQIESQQAAAAKFEREGRTVPEAILKSLESLYASLEQTEDSIKDKQKENEEEKKRFDYEINRYKQLKGLK